MNTPIHYGFYLYPGIDDALIEFLKPYVRARRVGEVSRQALTPLALRQVQASPGINLGIPGQVLPTPAAVFPAHPAPPDSNEVLQKARRAFLK